MSSNNIKRSHILGLDVLRFLAAVIVVWYHYVYLMGAYDGTAAAASRHLLNFPELYDWASFGRVGVEIFFVISGFVIAFSAERATAFSFFVSRVVRLGPGVWICSTITLLAMLVWSDEHLADLLREYRHSMAFLPWGPWIDGAFWTLTLEIAFYFCVFILILFKRFDAVRTLAIAMGIYSTVMIVLRALMQAHAVDLPQLAMRLEQYAKFPDILLLYHGVFFAIGVLLWVQMIKRASVANVVWMALFGVGGLVEIYGLARGVGAALPTVLMLAPCAVWIAGVVGVVLAVRLNDRLHDLPQPVLKVLKAAGLMTFPLYLIHMIFGATIMGRFVMMGMSRWTALAAGIAVALLLALAISQLFEPPLQRAIKRVLYVGRDKIFPLKSISAGNT
jgi:peptidoglycan/LPS O-acetylase OafA/YrhL